MVAQHEAVVRLEARAAAGWRPRESGDQAGP
jgi:hypothetical protein